MGQMDRYKCELKEDSCAFQRLLCFPFQVNIFSIFLLNCTFVVEHPYNHGGEPDWYGAASIFHV
jgi:hypothetical protein